MYRSIRSVENMFSRTGKTSRDCFSDFHKHLVLQIIQSRNFHVLKLSRSFHKGVFASLNKHTSRMKILNRIQTMDFSTTSVVDNSKSKEYEGRKLIGFSMDQIYKVVADVEHYKNFVPFCKKSEILYRGEERLRASLVIGFPPLHESYTSKVTMHRPYFVKAECTDGKLFNHLNTLWIFSPGLKNNSQTCVIDFSLSFEFKSVLHSHLSNLFFNEIVRQMENAFIDEAHRRYGRPCVKTVKLER